MRRSTYSTYSVSTSRPWLKWLGATFVFGAFVVLMWFATSNKEALMKDEEDLELVSPLTGAVKVRAGDPGGMEVANRDKQVFDLLEAENTESITNETLCDSAEGELVCNKSLPKVTHLASNPEAVQNAKDTAKAKSKNTDIASLITGYEKEEAPKPVKPIIKEPAKAVKVVKPQPVKEVAAVTVVPASGSWGVQLASYKSIEGADRGSKIFLKKFPSELKGLTYMTERIEIKDKGTFYRVQFIGLKDKAAAKKHCAVLKEKGQGCWYVSR